jgi:integrase
MPRGGGNAKRVDKRAFTDDEMVKLLTGDAGETLMDMMKIAALSGMRRGDISYLTVANCAAGVFDIQEGKTENAARKIPIHPDLSALVKRRSKGKAPGDYLIEELTAPPSRGDRGRGDMMSRVFTTYRRKLGIDVRRADKAQAEADFHSLRRWFATKAERAGNPDHIISAVLGAYRGAQIAGNECLFRWPLNGSMAGLRRVS